MKRRLRIAVSVFFALVAVAFALLWVRSYWHGDGIIIPIIGTKALAFGSAAGGLNTFYGATTYSGSGPVAPQWRLTDMPITPKLATELDNRSVFYFDASLGWFIGYPHWLVIVVATSISLAAGLRIPNQFSLRTMLIATTLVAVALALAVWASR
jgi:hypothetical protein